MSRLADLNFMQTTEIILATICITLLFLFAVKFLPYIFQNELSFSVVALSLTISAHIIATLAEPSGYFSTIGYYAVIALAANVPLFFMMTAQRVFSEEGFPKFVYPLIFAAISLIQTYKLYTILNPSEVPKELHRFLNLFPQLPGLVMVAYSFFVAYSTGKADLVDWRRRFRKIFLIGGGTIIIIVTVVELTLENPGEYQSLEILKLCALVIILVIFHLELLKINSEYFTEELVKKTAGKIKPGSPAEIDQLNLHMRKEEVYTDDTLTLKKLASALDIQEYRLRHIINAQLGYSNFNQYLNDYRIETAKNMIKSEKNLSMIEIAFALGFKSLSPFNKAFKKITGKSPSEYKKTG